MEFMQISESNQFLLNPTMLERKLLKDSFLNFKKNLKR